MKTLIWLGIVGNISLLVRAVDQESLLGKGLRISRETSLGGILPVSLTAESNINDSPVLIKRASIEDAKYYTNLAGAAFCQDESIARFNCTPYCRDTIKGTKSTKSTSQVKVLITIRDALSGLKGYFAIIPSRKEFIISLASERAQTNRIVALSAVLFPLDINYPENNNENIKTDSVSVNALLYLTAARIYNQYGSTLKRLLEQPQYKRYRIMLTGHSIGAEVASLSTIIIHNRLQLPWPRIRYLGYAMIRVGNREFVRWFNQQALEATHVDNYNDKITHVPLKSLNYQHFGNMIFINKDKSIRLCDNNYFEDPQCNLLDFDLDLRLPHVKTFDTEFGIDC